MKFSFSSGLILIGVVVFTCTTCELLEEENEEPAIPGKIVYSTPDKNGRYQLFTRRTDGSDKKQLTHFENDEAFNPAWSNDGTQIAFTTTLRSSSAGASLFVMNADGSNIRPLKERQNSNIVTPGNNPEWSPGDSKIAFDWCTNCELGGNNFEIYVYDFTSDQIKQVTDIESVDFFPKWKNNAELLYITNRDYYQIDSLRAQRDIYSFNFADNKVTRVIDNGEIGSFTFRPLSSEILVRPSSGNNSWYYFNYTNNDSTVFSTSSAFSRTYSAPVEWSFDGNFVLIRIAGFSSSKVKYSFFDISKEEFTDFLEKPKLINGIDWFSKAN